jgi:hypothetical protein
VGETLIITGAYGSGKTECALALALRRAADGPVTLVDLDFVNPYFRAQDHRDLLERRGVRVIAPDPQAGPIDAPSIPPATRQALLHPDGQTIVDLGGDPVGAVVIAQFAPALTHYTLWAVLNFARPMTADTASAGEMLRALTAATGLRVTGLISNTHLGAETTASDVLDGLTQTRAVSELHHLPVMLVAVPAWLDLPPVSLPVLPITPCLRRPWE